MFTDLKSVGAEFQINSTTAGFQMSAQVTNLTNGGYIVTWVSDGQDGSGLGIYGQRYDASGAALGVEFQINTHTALDQMEPSVTGLDGGGFVVTWVSQDQDGSAEGIYGQRYDASGIPQGAEFQINTETTSGQMRSSVASLSDGGFVVTWTSYGQDGDLEGVYGQRYDASGVAQGIEFLVNSHTAQNQSWSSVTGLDGGGFVVTWMSELQDGDLFGIFGQRYDASGVAQGAEFQVNTHTSSYQVESSVTAMADGGFVVTWMSMLQDGDMFGIYGQRFSADGVAIGAEELINTTTVGDQAIPTVTTLADGSFVVAWQDDALDGDLSGIFGQHFAAQTYGTFTDDTLTGDAGDNWIGGLAGADTLSGLDGNDTLFGANGADTLTGGAGDDLLRGGRGNDVINGGAGDDRLRGGRGDDTLNGGSGSDSLRGKLGADTFVFDLGSGNDRIGDFTDDVDTIHLDAALWGGGLTEQQVVDTYANVVGNKIVLDFGGGDSLILRGFNDLVELTDDIVII